MNRVEQIRRLRGVRQYVMADAVGMSASRLCKIESGKATQIRIEEALAISHYLQTPVAEVFPEAVPVPANATAEPEANPEGQGGSQ